MEKIFKNPFFIFIIIFLGFCLFLIWKKEKPTNDNLANADMKNDKQLLQTAETLPATTTIGVEMHSKQSLGCIS